MSLTLRFSCKKCGHVINTRRLHNPEANLNITDKTFKNSFTVNHTIIYCPECDAEYPVQVMNSIAIGRVRIYKLINADKLTLKTFTIPPNPSPIQPFIKTITYSNPCRRFPIEPAVFVSCCLHPGK